jgi:flagella basal body P-ring formation protein FlgA
VAAAHNLDAGTVIRSSDLTWAEIRSGDPSAYVDDPARLLGHVLKRAVPQGVPVRAALAQLPTVVERGDRIDVVWGGPGLDISLVATAMQSGAMGDEIRVMNGDSRRVIRGVVVGANRVEVRR